MHLGAPERMIVWQKSMDLVVEVYAFTGSFPRSEAYGLTSQMRRAAVSIPSNIAEGRRRGSTKEFTHFVRIAFGSAAELHTQVQISKRLRFDALTSSEKTERLLDEVLRMLNVLSADA